MWLMGADEICRLLGVSRQRTYRIMKRADFPQPVQKLKQGAVWATDEVEAWAAEHRRPREQK